MNFSLTIHADQACLFLSVKSNADISSPSYPTTFCHSHDSGTCLCCNHQVYNAAVDVPNCLYCLRPFGFYCSHVTSDYGDVAIDYDFRLDCQAFSEMMSEASVCDYSPYLDDYCAVDEY